MNEANAGIYILIGLGLSVWLVVRLTRYMVMNNPSTGMVITAALLASLAGVISSFIVSGVAAEIHYEVYVSRMTDVISEKALREIDPKNSAAPAVMAASMALFILPVVGLGAGFKAKRKKITGPSEVAGE